MFERSDSLTTNSHKLNYIGKFEMRYIFTHMWDVQKQQWIIEISDY